MARLTGVFLDTSVLLGGTINVGPSSRPAQAVMDAVAEGRLRGARTAWHCCLEYYAVATRLPEELRLAPADALRLLEEEVLGRLDVVDLPAVARLPFLRSAVAERVAGGRLYDAHIAEIARRSGSDVIVTDNVRHFRGRPESPVRVLSAAELTAELRAGS
ncbi:MAG TPA: PIN domain-containing protein [Thermoanaerobaculia bacterium]|nr:PIN domain-containing protein [Thermoanaerobaculia bacterium]HQN09047.1 PIN domain-containing protein [Thermoanaerobaculia bacterium]